MFWESTHICCGRDFCEFNLVWNCLFIMPVFVFVLPASIAHKCVGIPGPLEVWEPLAAVASIQSVKKLGASRPRCSFKARLTTRLQQYGLLTCLKTKGQRKTLKLMCVVNRSKLSCRLKSAADSVWLDCNSLSHHGPACQINKRHWKKVKAGGSFWMRIWMLDSKQQQQQICFWIHYFTTSPPGKSIGPSKRISWVFKVWIRACEVLTTRGKVFVTKSEESNKNNCHTTTTPIAALYSAKPWQD